MRCNLSPCEGVSVGQSDVNVGPMFTNEGGTIKGWCLVVGKGDDNLHKSSPILGATVATSTTQLGDLVTEAQTSQTAFEDELPTSEQDDLYESVQALQCP